MIPKNLAGQQLFNFIGGRRRHNSERKLKALERRWKVLATWIENPHMCKADLARRFGVSKATITRDLAELAGVGWTAVSRSNYRLTDTGLVELSDLATPELANRWNLVDVVSSENTQSLKHVTECSFKKQELSHDAFRRSGLGKAAAEIYNVLCQRGEATPQELQQATGRGRVTVWRKLRTMEQLMMVETTRPGWYQALDVNLDSVAKVLRTAGLAQRQREKHIQQRRAHRLELSRQPSARAD